MTYIYDILINLNSCDISFYEWRETDDIGYLKKGVLIKVSEYIYKKIVSNNIVVGSKTLNMLKDKSCVMKNRKIETIPYMGVFTDGKDTIGISFSKEGRIQKKTRFIIQDELELLESSRKLKTIRIDYIDITDKKVEVSFKTREETEMIDYILNSLDKIKNDNEKVKYLYYEWFNQKGESNNLYNELIIDIKKNYSDNKNNFLKLLDLINAKNNV